MLIGRIDKPLECDHKATRHLLRTHEMMILPGVEGGVSTVIRRAHRERL